MIQKAWFFCQCLPKTFRGASRALLGRSKEAQAALQTTAAALGPRPERLGPRPERHGQRPERCYLLLSPIPQLQHGSKRAPNASKRLPDAATTPPRRPKHDFSCNFVLNMEVISFPKLIKNHLEVRMKKRLPVLQKLIFFQQKRDSCRSASTQKMHGR